MNAAVHVCVNVSDLLDRAEAVPDRDPSPDQPLRVLLPSSLGENFVLEGDIPLPDAETIAARRTDDPSRWLDGLRDNSFQEGLERWWRWRGAGPLAEVQVLRFGSHANAVAFQRWIIGSSCVNSRTAFAVEGMPEAIGLQIAWKGGDISEQVSFVHGPKRYLVSIRAGGSAPPRSLVLHATERLVRIA